MDIKVQYNPQDGGGWAAVFVRGGEPWFLNGALVGMSGTPASAVDELIAIATWLVIHGDNFLTDNPLSLADRCWLYSVIEQTDDESMYAALREAFGSSTVKMLETIRQVRTPAWDLPDDEEQ